MENIICDADYVYESTSKNAVVKIEHGLKVRVDKKCLDELQNNKEITDAFKLNVKRLDRWYYSVYFDSLLKA